MNKEEKTFKKIVSTSAKAGQVKRVYRCKDENAYRSFFVDMDDSSHFGLFLNKVTEKNKLKRVGIDLKTFWPLDSSLKADQLLQVLKEKLEKKQVQIQYNQRTHHYNIKYIKITNETNDSGTVTYVQQSIDNYLIPKNV